MKKWSRCGTVDLKLQPGLAQLSSAQLKDWVRGGIAVVTKSSEKDFHNHFVISWAIMCVIIS